MEEALPVVSAGSCPFVQSGMPAAMLTQVRDTAPGAAPHARRTCRRPASVERCHDSWNHMPGNGARARHRRTGDEHEEHGDVRDHTIQGASLERDTSWRPSAASSEPVREARSRQALRRPKMCSLDVELGVLDDCSNARREPPSPARSAAASAGACGVCGRAGYEGADLQTSAAQGGMSSIGTSHSQEIVGRAAGGRGELGDAGTAADVPRRLRGGGPGDRSVSQSTAAKLRLVERCDADHVFVRIWRSAKRAARRETVKLQSAW